MGDDNFSVCARIALTGIVLLAVFALLYWVFFLCTKKLQKHLDNDCDRKCVYLLKKDFIYMSIIAGIVIVILLTLTFAKDENAINYFSFAGTLSSIILSVVAIFMTINSENESKDAKTQLDRSIAKMEESTQAVEKASDDWKNTVTELQGRLDTVRVEIEDVLERIQKVADQNDQILVHSKERNFKGEDLGWVPQRRNNNG
ncbi:hypothetical protein K350107B32_14350 [Agathobaculum butyriciproducens]